MTRGRRLGTVLALCVVLVSCGGDGSDDSADTTAVPTSTTSTTAPSAEDQAAAQLLESAEVVLTEIASFTQPTNLVARSGDANLYVTERTGTVRRIRVETPSRGAPRYSAERSPMLDISDDVVAENQEQGLLGLVFSSDGRSLFLAYTNTDGDQQLDRYAMNGDRVDVRSRSELLVIPDFAGNHNGGQLAFGPDGFLYWGMGDGGGGGDPEKTGQNPDDLLGSLLRIDPDGGDPYGIPPSNPFATGGGAEEVWAYGLRNPWRFSFDRDTGDLWIGDVGQGEREEVDVLLASNGGGRGANLGWSLREGDVAFEGGEPPADAVEPILAYGRDRGCSVIGGYVYRGTAIAELAGAYLYSDACNGEVRALAAREGRMIADRGLGVNAAAPSSFGQDNSGDLYFVSLEGPVYRIDPTNPPATTTTR